MPTQSLKGVYHAKSNAVIEAQAYHQSRAGVGGRRPLTLASGAPAEALVDMPTPNTKANHRMIAGVEEIDDFSLAEFHVLDKENRGASGPVYDLLWVPGVVAGLGRITRRQGREMTLTCRLVRQKDRARTRQSALRKTR
jgi:hypothetical protein